MPVLRTMYRGFNRIFEKHYVLLWLLAMGTFLLFSYLKYQLDEYNHDLLYFKTRLVTAYREMENYALLVIGLIVVLKIVAIAFSLVMHARAQNWRDELSQLELRNRYAVFLFVRLITEIDRIEEKYLRVNKRVCVPTQIIVKAHDEMGQSISQFRCDARKLLSPSEEEMALPVTELYRILEEEEALIRHSRFYKMNIQASDDLIRSLVNPSMP